MSDAISIRTHAFPWSPTPGTELVTEYDRYDIPLMGHLRQDGVDYIFWCIDGATTDVSLWAYAWVSEDELATLEEAEDFDDAFAQVAAGRPVVVALYEEGSGIVGAFPIDHPSSFDSLVEAARSQIRGIKQTVGVEPVGAGCY